jgi:hypothetical protein
VGRNRKNAGTCPAKIAGELARSRLVDVVIEGKQPVLAALRYIRERLDRMNYAEARRQGLPIGSGNVEATCKALVAQRMKRAGARWKHKTGEEVLQLRALMKSDRWQPAIQRALKPLAKPVRIGASFGARAAA